VKARSVYEGERVYDSEKKYWHDLLGPIFFKTRRKNPKIKEGDVVVLKNFQLSPWSPRYPGLYWTRSGEEIRNLTANRLKHDKVLGLHFDPDDKRERMLRGGMGTVRLARHDRLNVYGATTSGKIDAAIPVVVSSNVTKNIIRFTKKYPLMEVDLRGVVRIVPLTYQLYHWSPHIPKLCLYVSSILNVNKYISDFSLEASAWTIYHNPKTNKPKRKFGYTYCHFNPIEESNIIDATDWIDSYIDTYTKGNGIALTDYDEITPRFRTAVLPLSNVMEGNVDYLALSSLFKGADFRQQVPLPRWPYR
jgi:hypothetical protein